jgi:hypothetical protein
MDRTVLAIRSGPRKSLAGQPASQQAQALPGTASHGSPVRSQPHRRLVPVAAVGPSSPQHAALWLLFFLLFSFSRPWARGWTARNAPPRLPRLRSTFIAEVISRMFFKPSLLRSACAAAIALAAAAAATSTWAGDKLYVQDSGKIMLVDVDAKSLTLVSRPTVDGSITDIATDAAGTLYVLTFNSLYRLAADGSAVLIGKHGIGTANALTFDGSGKLYGASAVNKNLYLINPTTAQSTVIGTLPAQSAGDLAYLNGRLFFAGENDSLGIVNLRNNQQSANVGSFGLATSVYGLAEGDSNTLYGAAFDKLFKVDPSTGSISYVMNFTGLGQAGGLAPFKAVVTRAEDRLFNYAEDSFPTMFKPSFAPSLTAGNQYYRFYRDTGTILSISNGQLSYSQVGTAPGVLGPVDAFLPLAIGAGY